MKLVLQNKHTLTVATLSLCLLSLPLFAAGGSGPSWSYEGATGPEHWGELAPEFALCGSGLEQSPVDIDDEQDASLPVLLANYKPAPVTIENNGHTVQHNISNGSTLKIGAQEVQLLQYHLHTPSEHTVNGASYPMEIHFVHKTPSGQLAVLGVFVRAGAFNSALEQVFKYSPKAKGSSNVPTISIDLQKLLPRNVVANYVHYQGSLTTPPCSQGVKWFVNQTPISASAQQIAKFKQLFHGLNARPTQDLNNRVIYERD